MEAAETTHRTSDYLFAITSGLQYPLSRGEIRLASADPLQHPIIDPRHLSHPRDHEAISRGEWTKLTLLLCATANLR